MEGNSIDPGSRDHWVSSGSWKWTSLHSLEGRAADVPVIECQAVKALRVCLVPCPILSCSGGGYEWSRGQVNHKTRSQASRLFGPGMLKHLFKKEKC